jgi:hypothetical protein
MIRKCNIAVVMAALTVAVLGQAMDAAALTAAVPACPKGAICAPPTAPKGGTSPGGTGETGITVITAPIVTAPTAATGAIR